MSNIAIAGNILIMSLAALLLVCTYAVHAVTKEFKARTKGDKE